MIKYVLKQNNNSASAAFGKWYAYPVVEETMDLEDLAHHMEEHNTGFSEAMCVGVMKAMVKCIKEQLLAGKNVKIDNLAIFSVGIRNREGAANESDFTITNNISGVKLRARATGTLSNANLNLAANLKKASALVGSVANSGSTPDNGGSNPPVGGGSTPSGGNTTTGGDTTPQTYTLNISSANTTQGTVNTSANKAYNAGAVVNITATPKAGYAFDKWSDGNTSTSRSVAMNKNLTLVASFKAVEPATSVDGISITSISNQPNGGSLEVNVNPQLVIRGTGLQKLTAANFVNSEGKVGTYAAYSDGRADLNYDDISSNEQTISIVVGGETLFTLNIKGNNVYEF